MRVNQYIWQKGTGWGPVLTADKSVNLVMVFGDRIALETEDLINQLREFFPKADIIGCSTAGEISGIKVLDNSIVITTIEFQNTKVVGNSITINQADDSYLSGKTLALSIPEENLRHVFVLSDGINVNGSELVKGITDHLPANVSVTGGLSGDGSRFKETLVVWNSQPKPNTIALIGFYGEALQVSYASLGGWDPFGPERLVTRSKGNILYELDGKSALDLYKTYLGDYAEQLPASGLLFPLNIRWSGEEKGVVRTILSVDEKEHSLIFAGDIPEGSQARLMKANLNRLTDGAVEAAKIAYKGLLQNQPDLALLISCVGRKMIMKQQVEEEVEGVSDVFGNKTHLCGFYSYGEISPFNPHAKCELHNQTMTITVFKEKNNA